MKKLIKKVFIFTCLLALFGAVGSWAEDKDKGAKKSIKFDEDVVEGMDRARLDSLTAKLGRDDDDGKHLYRKRQHFRKENQQVMKELVFSP